VDKKSKEANYDDVEQETQSVKSDEHYHQTSHKTRVNVDVKYLWSLVLISNDETSRNS
jgi:hypothetical protein